MTEKEEYLKQIQLFRDGETINRDPQLIAYMVRDWKYTKESQLSDLCWAMCGDSVVVKNDVLFLLEELEKFIQGSES